jgi:hypothetical protein
MKTPYSTSKLSKLRIVKTTWLAALTAAALLSSSPGLHAQFSFATGDRLISDNFSQVLVFDSTDALKGTLTHPVFSFTTGGMAFDHMNPVHLLLGLPDAAPVSGDIGTVGVFNSDGTVTLPGTFGTGYRGSPFSMVLDRTGNVYVGEQVNDPNGDVLKFNSTGTTLLAQYQVQTVAAGAMWVEMACDQVTLYYTSGSRAIKRFNTSTATQSPDFVADTNTLAYTGPLGALRIIPDNWPTSATVLPGQVVVAAGSEGLIRFTADGSAIAQTYTSRLGDNLAGISFDPMSETVWTLDTFTGEAVEYIVETGTESHSFPANATAGQAIILKGERLCGNPLPPPSLSGRMTGGGAFPISGGGSANHGFTLHNPTNPPNHLTVLWKDSSGNINRFKLTSLTSATLFDDPTFSPNPPRAGFDTYVGVGTGELNGVAGASANWTFTDHGEPGTNDTVNMTIRDKNGVVVLMTVGTVKLTSGNHQAHP